MAERVDEDALDLGGAEFSERLVDAYIMDGEERVGKNAHAPVRVVPQNLSPTGEALDNEEIITGPNYTPPGHVSVERMGFTRQAEPEGLPEAAVGG